MDQINIVWNFTQDYHQQLVQIAKMDGILK